MCWMTPPGERRAPRCAGGWRDGESWFWDTLADADAGSNPANWQWVAGCGIDHAKGRERALTAYANIRKG